MGCAVLLMVVGCAGVRSQAPQKEEQGHTEATASEEVRCSQTRTYKQAGAVVTTNDVPGCPKGGLLSGTDKIDFLNGKEGEDEIHGLGGLDAIEGGGGNDVIYGGPGDDQALWGARGDDVIYGGDGNDEHMNGGEGKDVLYGGDGSDALDGTPDGRQQDKLYCGEGRDYYYADKNDYVDSSCEEKLTGVPL
jgi:Ca2+-binding RTX toxin-like protein